MSGRARLLDALAAAALLALLVALVVRGAAAMDYPWRWARLWPQIVREVDGHWMPGPLLRGLGVTLEIAAAGAALALAAGLATALMALSSSPVARFLARAYVEVARNTPLLAQMLVVYFVLAKALGLTRWQAGVLTLGLYEGAFAAEIVRGAILAVAAGQWEAARALGLRTGRIYRHVVLPQALPLMLPPLTGVLVNAVKHSSIVSVIAIFDLTTEGRALIADTFMSFEVWLAVAALYLAVTVPLSAAAALLERRLAPRPA